MQERFFILGCQRTGTTLMRLILEDLPPARLIGFKILRWTEQLNCQVLFDDGAEGPCEKFYRGEKILFFSAMCGTPLRRC